MGPSVFAFCIQNAYKRAVDSIDFIKTWVPLITIWKLTSKVKNRSNVAGNQIHIHESIYSYIYNYKFIYTNMCTLGEYIYIFTQYRIFISRTFS